MLGALALPGVTPGVVYAAAPTGGLKRIGAPQPFDYAWLKGHARALSGGAHQAVVRPIPEAVRKLDWDQYQAIRYRADHALWAADGRQFQARFFHLGLFFLSAVRMHEVANGQAQELAYDPEMFDYGKSGLKGGQLPHDLGFAGFQLYYHTDLTRDMVAFLGASYFRAVGGEMQYGLSARGLAIDTGMARPEEFPSFTAFWLERPAPESGGVTVYALLDSPSATGAYRFAIFPGATTVMDVDAAIYPRKPSSGSASRRSPACTSTARTIAAWRTTGGRRFTIPTGLPCGPAGENGSGGRSSIRHNCVSTRTVMRIRVVSA
jgi:glucans biosynthesis protein